MQNIFSSPTTSSAVKTGSTGGLTYSPPTQTPSTLSKAINNYNTKKSIFNSQKDISQYESIARASGVVSDLNNIVAGKGEGTTYLSGGWISDIFDVLNTFDYGMVGLLKGKGFVQGIKDRESFTTNSDGTTKTGWGFVAGLIGDIIVDPTNLITPEKIVTKLGLAPKITKAVGLAAKTEEEVASLNKAQQAFKSTWDYVGKKVVWMYGQPEMKSAILSHEASLGKAQQTLLDISRSFSSISKEDQIAMAEARKTGKALSDVSPEAFAKFQQVESLYKDTISWIGDLRPDLKPMLDSHLDTYFPIRYTTKIDEAGKTIKEAAGREWSGKPIRTDDKLFVKRLDLPEQLRDAMGEIKEYGYPMLSTISRLIKFGKDTEFINGLSKSSILSDVAKKGYKLITGGKALAGTATAVKNLFRNEIASLNLDIEKGLNAIKRYKGQTKELDAIIEALSSHQLNLEEKTQITLEKLSGLYEQKGFKQAIKPLAKSTQSAINKIQKQAEKLQTKWNDKMLKASGEASGVIGKLTEKEALRAGIEGAKTQEIVGKYAPEVVADYLNGLATGTVSGKLKIFGVSLSDIDKSITAAFKYGKVMLNPASQVRNVISDLLMVLLAMGTHFPAVATKYFKELASKTGYYKELEESGHLAEASIASELKDILHIGSKQLSGKAIEQFKKIGSKISAIREGEEKMMKGIHYTYARDVLKMNPEEAWNRALTYGIDYSHVTPMIKSLRQTMFGLPFITYSAGVIKPLAETIYTHPGRLSAIGKLKEDIENLSDSKETEAERANEPQWMRDGWFIKIPLKDSEGRSTYIDLSYFLPFGNIIDGSIFSRAINRETGLPEDPFSAAANNSPALTIIRNLSRNEDFYGNKIWKASDSPEQQLGDMSLYVIKQMSPSGIANLLPGGYKPDGTRKSSYFNETNPASSKNTTKDVVEKIIANAGISVTPVNLDTEKLFMSQEKEKAMETFLEERGLLKTFTKTYVPKNK